MAGLLIGLINGALLVYLWARSEIEVRESDLRERDESLETMAERYRESG